LGTERTFSLINDVSLYDLKTADKPIGYRISGTIKTAAIWGSDDNGFLLRFEVIIREIMSSVLSTNWSTLFSYLQLESPQLYLQKLKVEPVDFDEKSSILKSHKKTKFYAFWRQGAIEKAFLPETKDASFDNFLRSILSLFQYQQSETETAQEDDISGTCQVKYISKSSTKFMKYKTDCTNDLEFHERLDKPLSANNRFTRVNVVTVSADGHLESIHSTDHHKFAVNAYPNVGFTVGSIFYLRVVDAEVDCKTVEGKTIDDAVKDLKGVSETTLLPVENEKELVGEKSVSLF
jgi:Lipoprotein amino terminal region